MRVLTKILFLALATGFPANGLAAEGEDARFSLFWTNGVLRISSPKLPSGKLEILYLEAFCRSDAHHQSWDRTKIPHRTTLLHASADGKRLEFETIVAGKVLVRHDVLAERDSIRFSYTLRIPAKRFSTCNGSSPLASGLRSSPVATSKLTLASHSYLPNVA